MGRKSTGKGNLKILSFQNLSFPMIKMMFFKNLKNNNAIAHSAGIQGVVWEKMSKLEIEICNEERICFIFNDRKNRKNSRTIVELLTETSAPECLENEEEEKQKENPLYLEIINSSLYLNFDITCVVIFLKNQKDYTTNYKKNFQISKALSKNN